MPADEPLGNPPKSPFAVACVQDMDSPAAFVNAALQTALESLSAFYVYSQVAN